MTLDHSNTPGLASWLSDGPAADPRQHRETHALRATRDASAVVTPTRYDIIRVMTPREQAEAAWHPGSRYSVAELEALIRQYRGMPARGVA
jgi:hypothetical protein